MNDPTLTPDDPKLTAYALGELSGDERAHIEAELRENPALRATVEEIRATAAQIEAALSAEALEEMETGETQSAHPLAHSRSLERVNGHVLSEDSEEPEVDYDRRSRGAKVLRFPQLYVVVATAAAACFALFVSLHTEEYATKQQAAETMARIEGKKRAASDRVSGQTVVVSLAPAPIAEAVKAKEPRGQDEPTPPLEIRITGPKLADADRASPPATAEPENKFALLVITKPDPNAIADASSPAPAVTFAEKPSSPAADTGAITGGIAGTIGGRSSEAATTNSPPPALVPKLAEGNATAQPATTVAFGGGSSASAFVAPTNPTSPPNDDIVRLDAFEVSADRSGALIHVGSLSSFATLTRGMPEHESLPRAPRGAQFGRAKDARDYVADNEFILTADSATSRFPIDVDPASYANVCRTIEQGARPSRDEVRIEELVNYFPYAYAAPKNDQAFAAALEVASAPWAPEHRLVRIGLKARDNATAQRGPANLVFLVDVSASMGEASKLPLVRESVELLVAKLRPDDRVAIVTYAANSVVVLPSTPVSQAREIIAALGRLKTAGTTDGASGLQLAYRTAIANFKKNGVNRVLLCTDGAFNTGITSERQLLQLIEEKTQSGIALTVFGFGRASERSTALERLAHKSGATYGYIDTRREAERFIVDQLVSSLAIIARDVNVQVVFNPAKVLAYRLIGYENRPLRREDYAEELGVAGEVGAGQAVTALYEIVPAKPADPGTAIARRDAVVKYAAEGVTSSRLEMPETAKPPGNEIVAVNVRYKTSNAIFNLPRTQQFALADAGTQFADASADFRFAAAVAEFGMILRGSPHRGAGSMRDVLAWANTAANPANDPRGYRHDFISIARKAMALVR